MEYERRDCVLLTRDQLTDMVSAQVTAIVGQDENEEEYELEVTVGNYGELKVRVEGIDQDKWTILLKTVQGSTFSEELAQYEESGVLDDYSTKQLLGKVFPFPICMVAKDRPDDNPDAHGMRIAFIGSKPVEKNIGLT